MPKSNGDVGSYIDMPKPRIAVSLHRRKISLQDNLKLPLSNLSARTAVGQQFDCGSRPSRSGEKLQVLRRPQYRLRVGDIRVFHDLSGTTVEVLAIVAKSEAESRLAQFGNQE